MKCLLIISLMFVLFGAVLCAPSGTASSNIGKTFHFDTDDTMTWKDALDYCSTKGWTLATIRSKEESDQLKSQLLESGNGANFWIGAIKLDGNWVWFPRRENLTYTDWESGQPDSNTNGDGAEDCVHLWNTQGYRWNDSKCNFRFYSVCEERNRDE